MSDLARWKKDMKKAFPHPKRGYLYVLWNNIYLRTSEDLWRRLSAIEVLELYREETEGVDVPETWLESLSETKYCKYED